MISLKEHHTYGPGFFQDRCPAGQNNIDVFYDLAVKDCTKENANRQIAMLLEPKSMIKDAYLYVGAHPDYFRYIFTHDSFLLQFDHARELNWGNVWLTTDSPKTKGISICTSYKNWCPLHYARLEIAKWYENRPEVDVFYGDWDTKPIDAKDYLEQYKFSIIIENDIDDYWYTEKILTALQPKPFRSMLEHGGSVKGLILWEYFSQKTGMTSIQWWSYYVTSDWTLFTTMRPSKKLLKIIFIVSCLTRSAGRTDFCTITDHYWRG